MLPFSLLIILGVVWASGYSIAKYAMLHGVPPLGYAFWQSLGPALLVTAAAKAHKALPSLNKKTIIFYLMCGLLGIAIPNTIMYYSASHLPAGLLAVIVNTVPLMTYPLALILRQERFDVMRFLGVLIGFAGLFFIVVPHTHWQSVLFNYWDLVALISPFSFALCAVYIGAFSPKDTSSLTLSSGMLIASTIILIPVVLASHSYYELWPPFQTRDYVIMLEILLSSLGYILFFRLITLAGPVYYSLVGGVVALAGLVLGWLIFNETLTLWNAIAVGLIILGIIIVTGRQHIATTNKA